MTPMQNAPLLQVRDLTVQFVVNQASWNVIDHLSFDLHRGKTLALVGESGCGKSMTALTLMAMLPRPPALAPSGAVLYEQRNLLTLSEKELRKIRGSKIAMIFQDPMSCLNPVYTIGDQLAESAQMHLGLPYDAALYAAKETMEAVGIANAAERLFAYPHQLSGGIKQRVMIAMALLCDPDILIADEPTTALDVTVQAQVLELFQTIQKKRNLAILLITHDMGVVANMADEVMVMYAAQGVEKGKKQELLARPAHPYTLGLFQSIPCMERQKKTLKPIAGQVPSFHQLPKGCRFQPRCPYAMPKCLQKEPPKFFLNKNSSHHALCWLHDGSPESQPLLEKMQKEQY